jgi:hypothetical protein
VWFAHGVHDYWGNFNVRDGLPGILQSLFQGSKASTANNCMQEGTLYKEVRNIPDFLLHPSLQACRGRVKHICKFPAASIFRLSSVLSKYSTDRTWNHFIVTCKTTMTPQVPLINRTGTKSICNYNKNNTKKGVGSTSKLNTPAE